MDNWKKIACGLCGNRQFAIQIETSSFMIVKCITCGLSRTILPKAFSIQYDDSYFDKKSYLASREKFAKIFARQLEFLEKYCEPGKLLDVGCGPGGLMAVARDRGWKVSGVEIIESGAKIAREDFGLDVKTGDIDVARGQYVYDAVIMNHVLEHIPNLQHTIERCVELLKPNGFLIIGVPNFDSWRAKLDGPQWISLLPEEHIWQFTPQSLTKLLNRHGFSVLGMHQESHSYIRPDKRLLNWVADRADRGEAMLVVSQKM